jgi:hypothetical protein
VITDAAGCDVFRSTRIISQTSRTDGRSGAPVPTAAESGGMPELRSRARDTDFSLIDLPRTEPIDDPPVYLREAVRWHFSPETGCPYWLKRAEILDFNGIAPQRCWRSELPGSYRFGRAPRLPQPTLYANDALSQLIQRNERPVQTHRREERI